MSSFLQKAVEAAVMSAGMAWQVGWSLVLGFMLSGFVQALVSRDRMQALMGRNDVREIATATAFGAASSSCSYASVAITRTLFRKGAALIPALAFLFASTNLVIELGIILYLLMGWQFTVAEWLGGVVLVTIMSVLVRLTYPARLIEAARRHGDDQVEHQHGETTVQGRTIGERLRNPAVWGQVARHFFMDVSMLWKDIVAGFVIAGVLAAFVPQHWWTEIFLTDAPRWLQVPANAVIGPFIAVISFVCSIGNVPMAAVLWGSGISFGGVLAFLYADLIVLPLLDAYRRAFGWRMAAYIGIVFSVTMVLAALLMDLAFSTLGLVPSPDRQAVREQVTQFSLNYTFWLNLVFGVLAVFLFVVHARRTKRHAGDGHGAHGHDHAGAGHNHAHRHSH